MGRAPQEQERPLGGGRRASRSFSRGRSALHSPPFPQSPEETERVATKIFQQVGQRQVSPSVRPPPPQSAARASELITSSQPGAAILTVSPPQLKSFPNTSERKRERKEGRAHGSVRGEKEGKAQPPGPARKQTRRHGAGWRSQPRSPGAYLGSLLFSKPSGTGRRKNARSRAEPRRGEAGARRHPPRSEGAALRTRLASQPACRSLPHSSASPPEQELDGRTKL